MTKITTYRMPYRRRREGKTNYTKRLALIKSGKPRMVVRKSNKSMLVQFIEYNPVGDKILFSANSTMLAKKFGWPSKRNSWTAYLTGLYAGIGAKKKGVNGFVLDIGMYCPSKGSVVFAALKGAIDAGLETAFKEENVPSDKLKNAPEAMKQAFENAKSKILSS